MEYKGIKLEDLLFQKEDCVAIITDHSIYDYNQIAKNSKLLFDTRNATKNTLKRGRSIVKL